MGSQWDKTLIFMSKISIEEDIKTLSAHDSFIRFMKFIDNLREEQIADMYEASDSNLQQITGRILSYDQLLEITDYKEKLSRINLP